jgi:hypothetical protein
MGCRRTQQRKVPRALSIGLYADHLHAEMVLPIGRTRVLLRDKLAGVSRGRIRRSSKGGYCIRQSQRYRPQQVDDGVPKSCATGGGGVG